MRRIALTVLVTASLALALLLVLGPTVRRWARGAA